ncbi:hypothetical protein BH09ACT10_BH09ACT10_22880 [soil metagenome]
MSPVNLHEHLDLLVGTWRTEGLIAADDGHEDEAWGGHDIYEWLPGGKHLAHRVDVEIFGERQESLEIFTPRAGSDGRFDQVSFEADGSVTHAVGWFDSDGRYHNDADEARALLTIENPDLMTAEWTRLVDGTWRPWMSVTLTRVGPPNIAIRSKTDHEAQDPTTAGRA